MAMAMANQEYDVSDPLSTASNLDLYIEHNRISNMLRSLGNDHSCLFRHLMFI